MKNHDNNFLYSPMIGNFLSWFVAVAVMALYVNGLVTHPWPMIAGMAIGPVWTLWIHAYHEAERIDKRHIEINHSKRLIQRGVACLIAGISAHLLADVSIGIAVATFLRGISASLFLGTIVWLLFDSFLSIHRGLDWDYISQEKKAARTDRLFRNHKWLWVASKIVGVVAGGFLYYYVLIVTSH